MKIYIITLFLLCVLCAQDNFLQDVQRRSFLYFWETANSKNGLIPDRHPTPSFSSVAAVGFALTSYIVGVEQKFITREQARARTLVTLRFLWEAEQSSHPQNASGFHGFFYHFLHMDNGKRFQKVELSSIDTALLMAGVLSSQVYFDHAHKDERDIRNYADKLFRRVNWQWMQNHPPLVSLGWHPRSGFLLYDWSGYSEAMLLYILALGSPTYPLDKSAWEQWTKSYQYANFYGEKHINFPALFGHQYSHIWIDFRGIQDDYMREKGLDYFQNSQRAVYANRKYCMENPGKWRGYSENIWGLTACDGPADRSVEHNGRKLHFHTYWARGASTYEIRDDGTIAPTAAGGSIPFAPQICISALREMYTKFGTRLYGKYGFRDAFNMTYRFDKNTKDGWFAKDWLGIDNGPIVLMIENYHSELIWELMKKNKYFQVGLKKAGFRGGWLEQVK